MLGQEQIDQWRKTENPETNSNTHRYLGYMSKVVS